MMKSLSTLWSRAAIAVALTSTVAVPAPLQEPLVPFEGLKEQFTISLPAGWTVYNQTEVLSGKPGPHGMLFFSAEPVAKPGEKIADQAALRRVDTGEIPSFFVDRHLAMKGMSCSKFKADYEVATMVGNDPVFGGAMRRMLRPLPPKSKRVELAGCQGVKIEGRGHMGPEKTEWVIDVRAVSDGKTLYLFSLRNTATNYSKNLETFERALATLKLSSSEQPR